MGKGERSNPLSPSFRMSNLAGEIPRIQFIAAIDVEVIASQAWLDAHPPDADGKRPSCPAADSEVRFVLMAQALFPSRFSVPAKWPKGEVPVGELLREPVPHVLALLAKQQPELAETIRAVLATADGETKETETSAAVDPGATDRGEG